MKQLKKEVFLYFFRHFRKVGIRRDCFEDAITI